MAKKSRKEGPSKSELIRQYMANHSDQGPQAVAAAMKSDHNIDVTPQFVSTIKLNAKKKAGAPKGRRGRKPASATASAGPELSYENLRAAKKLILQIGGPEKAKAAVALLADLMADKS